MRSLIASFAHARRIFDQTSSLQNSATFETCSWQVHASLASATRSVDKLHGRVTSRAIKGLWAEAPYYLSSVQKKGKVLLRLNLMYAKHIDERAPCVVASRPQLEHARRQKPIGHLTRESDQASPSTSNMKNSGAQRRFVKKIDATEASRLRLRQ